MVTNCLLCDPNKEVDEECILFRECIRENRAELDDESVTLLKNIDILTGQALAGQPSVLELGDDPADCKKPSDPKVVRSLKECNCLQTFHEKCDGNKRDQQACLSEIACTNPDVCQSWKVAARADGTKNCPHHLTEALIERRARSNTSRHAAELARSDASKGLDESLTLKRTCR